jgi:hypothetical protein
VTATATDPNNNTSEFSYVLSVAGISPGALQFSAATYNVIEGAGNAVINVTRTGGAVGAVSVNYTTSDGSGNFKATAPKDYKATTGTLNFADGETSKPINIPIVDEDAVEMDENFLVTLSSPANGTSLGLQTTAQIFILDNDATFFSINNVSVAEGNSGTTNASFTVSLSADAPYEVAVDYATVAGGTATVGNDYQPASGQQVFTPGEKSKPLTIAVNGDTTQEPNETPRHDLLITGVNHR